MRWITALFFCLAAAAQVAEPQATVVMSSDGTVRELLGTPGGFLPGATLAGGAKSAAVCDTHVVMKLDRTIRFDDAEFDAPEGPAFIGFGTSCTHAVIYFSAAAQFALLTAVSSRPLSLDPALVAGEVVAVGGEMRLLVQRADGLHDLRFRSIDGALESDRALGFSADAALILSDGTLVYATGTRLSVQDTAGTERSLEIPNVVVRLSVAGERLIQVTTEASSLVLRIRTDRLDLHYVPEPAQ